MRLLIAGGGTGGHLYPGVAVAEELLARGGHEVRFAGSAYGIEARVLPKLGLPFSPVRCGALIGRGMFAKTRAVVDTLLGIGDASAVIGSFKPDACLGVGGYASFPVAAAARMRRVPTAIQEQNASPGLANKILSRIAEKIYAGDEAAAQVFPREKTRVTGTPLRNQFKAPFPYEPPTPGNELRVLVLGGSQGAASLNRIVPEAMKLLDAPIAVRHQAGRGKEESVKEAYGTMPGATVEAFIDDMAAAYAWSQLVVARAGALTLAELASAGRPAILVPFPHAAGNHQEANARAYEKTGSGLMLLERDLTAETLAAILRNWRDNPGTPEKMAGKAAAAARRDAARAIVDDLILLSGGRN